MPNIPVRHQKQPFPQEKSTFILDFLSPQFSEENDVGNNDKPDDIHVDSVSFQSV